MTFDIEEKVWRWDPASKHPPLIHAPPQVRREMRGSAERKMREVVLERLTRELRAEAMQKVRGVILVVLYTVGDILQVRHEMMAGVGMPSSSSAAAADDWIPPPQPQGGHPHPSKSDRPDFLQWHCSSVKGWLLCS